MTPANPLKLLAPRLERPDGDVTLHFDSVERNESNVTTVHMRLVIAGDSYPGWAWLTGLWTSYTFEKAIFSRLPNSIPNAVPASDSCPEVVLEAVKQAARDYAAIYSTQGEQVVRLDRTATGYEVGE